MLNPYRIFTLCTFGRTPTPEPLVRETEGNVVFIDRAAVRRAEARERFLHGGPTIVDVPPMVDWREVVMSD